MPAPTRSLPLMSFMLSMCLSSIALSAESTLETPLELLPYRVRLLVDFDAPNQSPGTRSDVLKDVHRMSDRCIGSIWRLTVDEIDWLQPASVEGLARLPLSEILSRVRLFPTTGSDPVDDVTTNPRNGKGADPVVENRPEAEKPCDIWFVAAVREFGSGWRVHVRAWQPDFRLESDPVGRDVADIRDLPLALVQLCHSAFSPVGKVDVVDGKTARVALQGGALLAPDETLSLAKTATVFIPLLIFRNREQRTEKLQVIPWTYLTVTASTQSRWTCEIQSGLRSPIGGKQRGRVETMVVAVRSTARSTRLELATQAKPSLPLIAHRIEMRDAPDIPQPDEVTEPDEHLLKLLLTDRRGMVSIAAREDSPVVWLFAYSGKHLLARVPFLPGSTAGARLEVPDDAPRLEAESELQALQGQLIESVAARNTLYARVRAKIKKLELSANESEEKEIQGLPDAAVYLERLLAVRVQAVKAAKGRKDRASEVRINRMCDEMADLIRQYLNEDKRRQLLEELKELRVETGAMKQEEGK